MALAATIKERIVKSALRSETKVIASGSLAVRTIFRLGKLRRTRSSTIVPRGSAMRSS